MYYYKSSIGIQSTLFIYIHKNLKLILESILLTVNFNVNIFMTLDNNNLVKYGSKSEIYLKLLKVKVCVNENACTYTKKISY